ncbi:MAG: hypothetical protein ABJE10_08875 [bacterium]
MSKETKAAKVEVAPDQRKLTERQSQKLSSMTGISAKEITGVTVAELSDKYKWRIDPSLLFFRRICGRVVKKDPISGIEYPVPFATVTVEDTDCSLIAYFPPNWQWGWFYPFHCRRETLATVHTDECGNFCAYIPWFDIDWILRWRRARICFPIIFQRPWLRDLLDRPELHPIPKDHIGPHGPGPVERLATLPRAAIEALTGSAGRKLAERVQSAQVARGFGAKPTLDQNSLNVRAFDEELPPPLPPEFQQARSGAANVVANKGTDPHAAVRSTIATHVGVEAKALEQLDLNRFIGPFRRCIDILLPQWQLIVDVPDITFKVTQDVNGDGIEETIYSEGYFDVRWDAGAIPDVTLVASSIAKESHTCDTPIVPCKNTPELLFAGLMPITDPAYFDDVNGYAKRPNKPKPPMLPRPVAETPFLGVLQLYGCVSVPGAAFYRVLASTGGGPFTAITGLSWNIYPIPFGPPHTVTPDASGWYPVLPNPNDFHLGNMVLEWPTPSLGKYTLKLETGTPTKAHLGFGNVVAIQVDNTAPNVVFTKLSWKFSTEPDTMLDDPSRNLLVPCPTIRRGAPARDIEVQFETHVNAHHLRDTALYSHGCGGGSFTLLTSPADTVHWHETVGDNSVNLSGRYQLLATTLEGAYGFGCQADSRAMNPAGSDNGHLLDWNYDPIYSYVTPEIEIAIVNA